MVRAAQVAWLRPNRPTTERSTHEDFFHIRLTRWDAFTRHLRGCGLISDTPTAEKPAGEEGPAGLALNTLPGLALDDAQAKLTGKWTTGSSLAGYYGTGYRYRGAKETGAARYEFAVKQPGLYEVRIGYAPHENRATNTPVTVESAEGKKTIAVNQRIAAPDKGFISLGKFRFEPSKPAVVLIGDGPADGNIHADAVQLAPVK